MADLREDGRNLHQLARLILIFTCLGDHLAFEILEDHHLLDAAVAFVL